MQIYGFENSCLYGSKCYRPIKLKDSLISNKGTMERLIFLVYGMEADIQEIKKQVNKANVF